MSNANPQALKTFLKHLSVAHGRVSSRNKARDDLNKRIAKLRKHGKSKTSLSKEIQKLEEAISQVMEKESLLITKESETEKRIRELEIEIERAKQQNVEIFADMRDNIGQLNSKIAKNINDNIKTDLVEVQKQLTAIKESGFGTAELHEEIRKFEENISKIVKDGSGETQHMKQNITELKISIKQLIEQKNDRDRKILQLEEKIKKKAEQSTIEEQIIQLEEKVLAIEDTGNYDKQLVAKLKEKINNLKAKLAQSKLDKIEKEAYGNVHETVPQDEHNMYVEQEDYHSSSAFPEETPDKGFDKLNLPHVSEATGVEFSSKGNLTADSSSLREEEDLDIPAPPPMQKKKGLFSKLFGK